MIHMLGILFLSLVTLSTETSSEASAGSNQGSQQETVRILRDPWGVPHVLGESDYGAMYGFGWAIAEDQLVNVLNAFWTVQGRRCEIEGKGALKIDRTFRLMRLVAEIEDAWEDMDPEFASAAEGYADGMNAWMAAHPEEVPEWAEPVRPSWGIAMGRVIDFIPQVRKANGKVGGLAPKLAMLRNSGSGARYDQMGSNAWAIGPSRSANGESMMLTDPHLPWTHEFRLYEVHLRGKTFECAGAGFVGVPLPEFARNAHLAWGWTWNGPDHADVYRLTLDPNNPERYIFDGTSMEFEKEATTYSLADGTSKEETLYHSVHGPITHINAEEGYAVAYRLSAAGQIHSGRQYLDMLRATNLDELNTAMEQLQVCHFNQVATDREGAIRYHWGGRVPVRADDAKFNKVMDGSVSSTLWDSSNVVPFMKMPQVRDPECGFVQNCNNSPAQTTGTAADPQPETYERGVGGGRSDTVRSWYLKQQLNQPEKISVDRAREIATDGYMIPHKPMSRLLRYSWENFGEGYTKRDEIRNSVEMILGWDGQPEISSPAPTIFTLWLWKAFDGRVMLPVSLMLKENSEVDEAFATKLFEGLRKAQKEIRSLIPFDNVPWGMLHIIKREDRVWPIATGMYPAISLMNANLVPVGKKLTNLNCEVGSAYVAFHVMDKDGIRSESILPLGQTDHQSLPYVDAMTDLFAERELKPLPFTDEELAEVKTTETILKFESPSRK